MATSKYFSNYDSKYTEQRLVESLITESIKIMGFDATYLANTNDAAKDLIFGENPTKAFAHHFQIESYLSSSNDYNGEREMFSKFGLEIKNKVSIIISKSAFTQRAPKDIITRPREGDLLYIPFLNGTGEVYEITFVNQNKDFFMLGRTVPYYYELELEKFRYSQEVIDTGMEEIDSIVTDSGYTLHLTTGSGTGLFTSGEKVFQSNDNTETNAYAYGTVQKWLPRDHALSITNIMGEFADDGLIIGVDSNAQYYLSTYDPLSKPAKKESYDNSTVVTLSQNLINKSETNPFGGL